MFGIGMPELILILVVALIVIGPKKLPEMARSLGKALNEFKGATQGFKNSLDSELRDINRNERKTDEIDRIAKQYKEQSREAQEPGNPADVTEEKKGGNGGEHRQDG